MRALLLILLKKQKGTLRTRRARQCRFTSTETKRTITDEEPITATSTFTQLLGSVSLFRVQVQCCFMSTETERTIRDGETRTATSTFTQLLSSADILILRLSSTTSIVQELCESRGGRPEPSVLTSLLLSVDVKNY